MADEPRQSLPLEVPARNMGGMPNAGTGPAGGPSNPNFGMLSEPQMLCSCTWF